MFAWKVGFFSTPAGGGGPAELVHFCKQDATVRTTSSTSAVELTDYTITWEDLTGAGFAAGDIVVLIVGVKPWANGNAINVGFAVGFGSTFAGRSEDATSVARAESPANGFGEQYLWVGQRTLVDGEDIYFRAQTTSGVASFDEFSCLVLNYDDIPSTHKLYATESHSGNAPSSYDTSGAGAATPAAGDWWIVASSQWLADDGTSDIYLAINDGTSDISEARTQTEDSLDTRVWGTMAYKAGLGSGVTVRARYKQIVGIAAPDAASTTIFGLRLDLFDDYWGVHSSNTVTHSVLDTYQEFAGNGSFALGSTSAFAIYGWPLHLTGELTKSPYGRIQIGGSDWPAASANLKSVRDNGGAERFAPLLFGYNSAQSAATLDIDLDVAEDTDVSPTYSCVEQVAVAFSFMIS